MSRSLSQDSRTGILYGVAAYGLWGMMPLYFRVVAGVEAGELLAHRIVWSVVLLTGLVTYFRRWEVLLRCLRDPHMRKLLAASTLLIAVNWYVFITGVTIRQVVQNSLGYFINPLLNIVLGVVLFGERLRLAQWVALLLAFFGVAYLILALGEIPWIALLLATSFASYGLIRKIAPVDSLVGLTLETMLLLPIALGALAWWGVKEELRFGTYGPTVDVFIVASGVVTAVPLLCFGAAARLLQLTTLGFLQYLAPILQFLTAVLVFGEPFRPAQQISFTLIWSALAIVTLDAVFRKRVRESTAPPQPDTTPS